VKVAPADTLTFRPYSEKAGAQVFGSSPIRRQQ
jgi:hypothetical protein